ncbi:MAG: UDP-4-amino-4,6-dideoxy-N-acetyl-beta-L-altrosamine transaminase [Oceanospirillum sp.]|nr:UDP-4-amino-4,6-dideoxy-N-acetyl-beta-L-altrosamine transaminase [Oceanospirillum sp.]
MIPYGRQSINQDDIDAVVEVLQSDFLTQGPKVPEFEQAVIDYVGASYGIAVNSATSALHLACLALGVDKGDWVWTSPITFVASANCALYCGAQVDFIDIDPDTYNLSPTALAAKLEQAKAESRLPKVVIAVHLSGQSCDMSAIYALAQEYGFYVIEDASHAIGGSFQGRKIGCCQYSDITVFSFHPVKVMTTAEGGVAVTNSESLATRMALLRGHGITRDQAQITQAPDGPWYYEQIDLGFNYRMTDLQAALGLSQLQRLDSFVSQRVELARRYNELLAGLPLVLPQQIADAVDSAWHLYIVRLRLESLQLSHREVFEQLRARGIGVNLHYIPVYHQPYYKDDFKVDHFPVAEAYYASALSLPLFYDMTAEQQQEVIAVLRSILHDARNE